MKNVALITGATSGIGKELACIHAEKGGDLVLVARNEQKIEDTKTFLEEKYGVVVLGIVEDLTDTSAVQRVVDDIEQDDVRVDILINNAGCGGQGAFCDRVREEDRDMVQLNILSLMELTRRIVPGMIERGQGRVLQVSSIVSFVPGPMQATYFASKAFVQSFANALGRELRGTGVTMTNLMPGPVDTGFGKAANLGGTKLLKGAVTPQSVAKDGYRAMMNGKIDVVSGLRWDKLLLLKISKLLPKSIALNAMYDLNNKA